MKVSIIIPNFNGKNLLTQNLPSVFSAGADEVIVVDDGSNDDSLIVLQDYADRAIIVKNYKNIGYAKSVNRGIQKASGEVCILLNTDAKPAPDFLESIKPYFEKPEVFAVNCHETGHSWASGEFVSGFVNHHADHDESQSHISFYASGGSAAFSRQKFIELGMYDTIFHPFYWEDTDISYRALKRGYEIWWEPNSHIEHQTSSTIKKYFNKAFIDYIAQRNELLFLWKNITDDDLFAQHKKALLSRLAKNPGYIKPVLGALKHISEIKKARVQEKQQAKKTDKEIFSLFTKV